jgi:SAM-dependent methyltransferase
MPRPKPTRKSLGAWYTPIDLLDIVTTNVLHDFATLADEIGWPRSRVVRVLDPACGDGRFLDAIRVRLHLDGYSVRATGCDVDADALATITHPAVRTIHADALTRDWGDERFDIVIGNPPFLSQMSAATTRGGASKHGGGPYANAAAEFLSLAIHLADPEGSVVGMVLPQSMLAARDAGPVRDLVDDVADHTWSWWQQDQRRLFDAAVNVCALGFRRPRADRGDDSVADFGWTRVVTEALGVPELDLSMLDTDGLLNDRADLNANFRDEYYALVPAVSDDADGPVFVTSGLIDPGRSMWGTRPVKFAKRTFRHPRVDLEALDGRFRDWAHRKLVPKVLVANQTSLVEAVADVEGAWIPGVPITSITTRPEDADPDRTVREIEALLTSPVASAWCWHVGGGTGMSSSAVRVTPAVLGQVPWPAGSLAPAVAALADGDVDGCGAAVDGAFGLAGPKADELLSWWCAGLPRRA